MSQSKRISYYGFTLVELMVTIGIVGVLTAIAIPSYQNHVARTRQLEVKAALTSIYTAELASEAQIGTPTMCLLQLGAIVTTGHNAGSIAINKSYYSVGFNVIGNSCGPGGSASCACFSYNGATCTQNCFGGDIQSMANATAKLPLFTSVNWYGGANPQVPNIANQSVMYSAASWMALGQGSVSPSSSLYDLWTIDQNKMLVNFQTGI